MDLKKLRLDRSALAGAPRAVQTGILVTTLRMAQVGSWEWDVEANIIMLSPEIRSLFGIISEV